MEKTAKPKINKKEIMRTVKFVLFSISAGVIQMVSSLLLKLLILDNFISEDASFHYMVDLNTTTFIADTIGLALSILWNFTFNRKFTFKAANNVPIAMLLAFLFYVPFYHFQIWYIDTIEKRLANIGDWGFVIALGTCMIINFVLEYLWQTFVVFRGAIDTNKAAQKEKADSEEKSEVTCSTAESDANKGEAIWSVKLTSTGSADKIALVKVIRKYSQLDLAKAKNAVDNLPSVIAEKLTKTDAQRLADVLAELGAQTEII